LIFLYVYFIQREILPAFDFYHEVSNENFNTRYPTMKKLTLILWLFLLFIDAFFDFFKKERYGVRKNSFKCIRKYIGVELLAFPILQIWHCEYTLVRGRCAGCRHTGVFPSDNLLNMYRGRLCVLRRRFL
jgi:hypothetical protein